MKPKPRTLQAGIRSLTVLVCALILLPGDAVSFMPSQAAQSQAQTTQSQAPSTGEQAPKIPPDQLDSLVAPIALYPDPLLAQALAASTYPLEIIQLQQWLEKNSGLKDKALVEAVEKQPWDPSVQAMAPLPEVVKLLADDVQWTTDLGNAFLAQQSDVMDAVQRMRKKAEEKGNLKSTEQQKVETKVVEGKSTIIVEQANPQVVYVPSYNPTVVYGAPAYPYPAVAYPPAGYYAAGAALSFGVGVAMGAAWGGGWGWGCGWGGNNDININRNNTFNRNANISGGNRTAAAGNRWQHNPQHRGGAPYRDQATANRFGGSTRGGSAATRQASARQQIGRQGGNMASARAGGGAAAGRGLGGGGTAGARGVGGGANAAAGRGVGGGNAAAGRGIGGGGGNFGGGANSIGGRDLSRTGGGNSSAFGGGSRGFSGSSARASSSRGSSSFGGGGRSRGGGGGRGGGGRRR